MISELFSANKNGYGDQYQDHYFEQYKLYVGSIEKISDRRQQANIYFITLNTALISFIGLTMQIDFLKELFWPRFLLAAVGGGACIVFWHLIRSYKQLNAGKFAVLHKIEERLPLAIYKHEWEVLGEGKNEKKYFPFSHVELYIPIVLGAIYAVFGIIFLLTIGQ